MTCFANSWVENCLLQPLIDKRKIGVTVSLPQIIGYTGRGDDWDRSTQDQIPHRDDKQDRALYNFSVLVNISDADAILKVAKGSHKFTGLQQW